MFIVASVRACVLAPVLVVRELLHLPLHVTKMLQQKNKHGTDSLIPGQLFFKLRNSSPDLFSKLLKDHYHYCIDAFRCESQFFDLV